MEDLIKALHIKNKYNKMDFKTFSFLLEQYLGKRIPEKEKEFFKFTGLTNSEFLLMKLDF